MFCFFCLLFCFPFFALTRKPCFWPPKGLFRLFLCVSLCFSLALFGPPPLSSFLFLWSLSCSFISSFLPVSRFCFWFLLFLFVLFAFLFQDVILLLFFVLSCFVLSHDVWFIFALYLVFLLLLLSVVSVAFICCNFWILATYQKTSLKTWKLQKKTKMKNAEKKAILTRAVSTSVLTNSVVFFFVFL